ncbi:MAG TPA: RNA polymerase Rpb4 family protein [Thermoplasmata archaeon]|nr:RNA polymerase Rpb4 family protein [Thermoplasmata archaeon]HUJ77526.1 RNA polymerase Rpb4 family protein [Thermoplasmata archaeon]
MPEPVPLSKVRALLTDEAAKRTLPREAMLAQQHAEGFARLTVEQTDELIAKLRALPYVDTSLAIKIADILPQFPEEVRLLLSKERVLLDEAQLTQLLDLVAQHR